jgi:hypothetical protein
MQDVGERVSIERSDGRVDMVRHDHKLVEMVTLAFEMAQCASDDRFEFVTSE